MDTNLRTIATQTEQIVLEVAKFIRGEYGQVADSQIEDKSHNNFVSFVDKTSEKMLIEGLGGIVEGATFLGEEGMSEYDTKAPWAWIIDPLDGTTNFLHQIPIFSISVALQHEGQTVVGIVYDVMREESFLAVKGEGATLNGRKISVRQGISLSQSLLVTGFPYDDFGLTDNYMATLKHFWGTTRGVRRLGSAAIDLAYVAAGRFDGFWEYSLAAWDVAAGAFLVEEAGGTVTDFSGRRDFVFGEEIIAAAPNVHSEMLEVIGLHFGKGNIA